jgi:hypothetical protein
MQNAKPQRKNSTISHGTPRGQACGHGLFDSCRELSTNRPVILQNKANSQKSQMNVRLNISRDYKKKSKWTLGENKPKQSQSAIGLLACGGFIRLRWADKFQMKLNIDALCVIAIA